MQEIEKQKIWPIILLLFTSTDTILFGTNSIRLFVFVPRIMALLMCFVIPFEEKRAKQKDDRTLFLALVMVFITVLSGVVNNAEIVTIISRALPIMVAFIISKHYSVKSYIKAFDNFLYPITVISIVFHLVAITMPQIALSMPAIINENEVVFRTIILCSIIQDQIGNSIFSRMSGPFWEPGAYAIYLCIGIMFQIFFMEKQSIKRLLIYIIALSLTYSTTGYISFGVIIIASLVEKRKNKNDKAKSVMLTILMLVAIVGAFNAESQLIYYVFGKIFDIAPTTNVRIASLISGFHIALDHPWLGVGGLSGQYMSEYASMHEYGTSSVLANTFVHQFANYGFLFGTLFVFYNCCFFVKQFETNKVMGFLLFVILMLLYMGETFFSFLPFVFVMYGCLLKGRNGEMDNKVVPESHSGE